MSEYHMQLRIKTSICNQIMKKILLSTLFMSNTEGRVI